MSSAKYPAQVSRSPRLKVSAASRRVFTFSSDIPRSIPHRAGLLSMQTAASRPKQLSRRLCLGRVFFVAPGVSGGVSLLTLLHESDAEFACQLDQDPDAGQHVEGGEDLQRLVRQREVRVGDARRGQRADG